MEFSKTSVFAVALLAVLATCSAAGGPRAFRGNLDGIVRAEAGEKLDKTEKLRIMTGKECKCFKEKAASPNSMCVNDAPPQDPYWCRMRDCMPGWKCVKDGDPKGLATHTCKEVKKSGDYRCNVPLKFGPDDVGKCRCAPDFTFRFIYVPKEPYVHPEEER